MILPIAPLPPTDNTGIVPPWLEAGAARPGAGRNPGIVPPWLQNPGGVHPVAPDQPVGPDVPRILGIDTPTAFDPTPIVADPDMPRILPVA